MSTDLLNQPSSFCISEFSSSSKKKEVGIQLITQYKNATTTPPATKGPNNNDNFPMASDYNKENIAPAP